MVSEEFLARRFAALMHDQEILIFRYLTEKSEIRKQMLGARMLSAKLRQSLLGAFTKAAAGIENIKSPALKNAVIQGCAMPPKEAVKRTFAMKNCIESWHKARAANNFSLVADDLQIMIDSYRAEGRRKAALTGLDDPYEALLQGRTPGLTCKTFEAWANDLVPFCQSALRRLGAQKETRPLAMNKDAQNFMSQSLLKRLGYDFTRGEVNETPHPMCMGMHDDVRLGMNYIEANAGWAYLNAAHEGGHALYRQNVPDDETNAMEGGLAGVGMDEAMALIMENHVARDPFYLQSMREIFNRTSEGRALGSADIQSFFEHINRLSSAPLRTNADEVRYPLDVIVRYRLEKALINGDLEAHDLPQAWAREYESLTGMTVPDDNAGVLQDIHWFGGEMAWFPNYLFGQLAAAQLFEAACEQKPDIPRALQDGNTAPLTDWLDKHVYSCGARLSPDAIIKKATGNALGIDAYNKHIENRYLSCSIKPLLSRILSDHRAPDLY